MSARLTKNFLETLRLVLKPVRENINYLNSGGCGYFALILGKRLEELEFKVEYIVLTKGENSRELANEAINDGDDYTLQECFCYHVVLKVNGRYIDSTGVYDDWEHWMGQYWNCIATDPMNKRMFDKYMAPKHKAKWNRVFDKSQIGLITIFINRLTKESLIKNNKVRAVRLQDEKVKFSFN